MANKILLQSLTCLRKEDWTGPDEAKLEVFSDGKPIQTFRGAMSPGQSMPINIEVEFDQSIVLRLWDEDNPPTDPDDFLGEIQITNSISGGTGVFNQDQAHYRLNWSPANDIVEDSGSFTLPPPPKPKNPPTAPPPPPPASQAGPGPSSPWVIWFPPSGDFNFELPGIGKLVANYNLNVVGRRARVAGWWFVRSHGHKIAEDSASELAVIDLDNGSASIENGFIYVLEFKIAMSLSIARGRGNVQMFLEGPGVLHRWVNESFKIPGF